MRSIRGRVKIGAVLAVLGLGVLGSGGVRGGAVHAAATPAAAASEQTFAERMEYYDKFSLITGIPWYELAAVDQYERSIAAVMKLPPGPGALAVHIPDSAWRGALNPNLQDKDPKSIALFGGIGIDGDGDGAADREDDADRMATMAALMLRHGYDEDDRRRALWDYYQNSRSVERIGQFARLYRTFGRLDLHSHAFVMPLGANYTFRDTWGASRGWGGARIHEGTDLFASYGVPVRSACYGIVEVKGWNPYGGWRIGVRDLNGVYYYFAHLSGFSKELKVGDAVKPGQVLGWVGSSGYGKPGTSGKFPPHLHFGLYRDSGLSDWAFDPYPSLRKWEREERNASRKQRS